MQAPQGARDNEKGEAMQSGCPTARILGMFLVWALFGLPGYAVAATYWVSPDGQSSWAGCRSETPLSGTAACNIATANLNAVAGDTVYLRAGT